MRTSFSQHNTYIKCPQNWHHSYVGRWKSPIAGASMFFGTAVDSACEAMLEGKSDWMITFHDYWKRSWNFGKSTQIFDNPDIQFSYKDFDKDVLQDKDTSTLSNWANQLNLTTKVLDRAGVVDLYTKVAKQKKNPYNAAPSKEEMKYFNRASWLSMKRKGEVLLKSFEEQFLPKVTKVVSTQKRADIKDPTTGDSVVGYIDMIVELEGYDKPIIIDLKTAARPYSQDQLDFSEQLTLYCAMKGTYALDKSDYVDTDLVGYVVLSKDIKKKKVSTCKSCSHVKTGRHKTCDNEIKDAEGNTERCNGEWDEVVVLDPEVQVMVAQKSQQQVDSMLQDIAAIIAGMKNGIIYRNTQNCTNWYGGKCPFFDACHHGDYSKLVKK